MNYEKSKETCTQSENISQFQKTVADNWLIINDTSDEMIIINKKSGKKRVLHK